MTHEEMLRILIRGVLDMPRELDPELAIDAAMPALRHFLLDVRREAIEECAKLIEDFLVQLYRFDDRMHVRFANGVAEAAATDGVHWYGPIALEKPEPPKEEA